MGTTAVKTLIRTATELDNYTSQVKDAWQLVTSFSCTNKKKHLTRCDCRWQLTATHRQQFIKAEKKLATLTHQTDEALTAAMGSHIDIIDYRETVKQGNIWRQRCSSLLENSDTKPE